MALCKPTGLSHTALAGNSGSSSPHADAVPVPVWEGEVGSSSMKQLSGRGNENLEESSDAASTDAEEAVRAPVEGDREHGDREQVRANGSDVRTRKGARRSPSLWLWRSAEAHLGDAHRLLDDDG